VHPGAVGWPWPVGAIDALGQCGDTNAHGLSHASTLGEVDNDWAAWTRVWEAEPVGTVTVSVSSLSGKTLWGWPVTPRGKAGATARCSDGCTRVEERHQNMCRTTGEVAWPMGTQRSALSGHAWRWRADRMKGAAARGGLGKGHDRGKRVAQAGDVVNRRQIELVGPTC
jgi:hypothetical protein